MSHFFSPAVVWGKLVLNAAINPLTALLNLRNGELSDSLQAKMLIKHVCKFTVFYRLSTRSNEESVQAVEEAVNVAKAKGVVLPYHDPIAKVGHRHHSDRTPMLSIVFLGRVSATVDSCKQEFDAR